MQVLPHRYFIVHLHACIYLKGNTIKYHILVHGTINQAIMLLYTYLAGVDFTKGFKTWHKFSTEIRFMLIPIIVLFIAHEFITGKF